MRRGGIALAAALLVGGCTPRPPASSLLAARPLQCRIGPDGGPAGTTLLAERGVGGTGAALPRTAGPAIPATAPATAPASPRAPNGIGGTGIVGVITGFGSVCLAGYEVGVGQIPAIDEDGTAAPLTDLRAGQLAILRASGDAAVPRALSATALAVRHEVVGPVEQVGSDGAFEVAGQAVVTAGGAHVAPDLTPGDWVAVSGLRRGDAIIASRIDAHPAGGRVIVHGRLEADGAGLHIGTLRIASRPADPAGWPAPGSMVVASGTYRLGALQATSVAVDALATDPGRFFPTDIRTVAIETFASGAGGLLRSEAGWAVPTRLAVAPGTPSVVTLHRAPGGLRAVALAPLPENGPRHPSLLSAPVADGAQGGAAGVLGNGNGPGGTPFGNIGLGGGFRGGMPRGGGPSPP